MKSGTGRNCFGLEENRSLNDCFVANGSLKNCDFNGETLFVYWKKKKKQTLGIQMLVASAHFSRREMCVDLHLIVLSC